MHLYSSTDTATAWKNFLGHLKLHIGVSKLVDQWLEIFLGVWGHQRTRFLSKWWCKPLSWFPSGASGISSSSILSVQLKEKIQNWYRDASLFYVTLNWLIDWLLHEVNLSKLILCLKVKELHSLYIHIYNFNIVV